MDLEAKKQFIKPTTDLTEYQYKVLTELGPMIGKALKKEREIKIVPPALPDISTELEKTEKVLNESAAIKLTTTDWDMVSNQLKIIKDIQASKELLLFKKL